MCVLESELNSIILQKKSDNDAILGNEGANNNNKQEVEEIKKVSQ